MILRGMSETNNIQRCDWAKSDVLINYHDNEWGVFTLDSHIHFEQICLSGLQAGLSWELILRRRPSLRRLFANFDYRLISCWSEDEVKRICQCDDGIRNNNKIAAILENARAFLELEEEHRNVCEFAFKLVGEKVIKNTYSSWSEIPAFSEESIILSDTFRRAGFKYFGPTIAYAYMQSVGFVDDHIISCFKTSHRRENY